MLKATDGLTTINPKEKTERKEFLAHTIEEASGALKRLLEAGVNRKAIVTLVAEDARLGKREVEKVIDSLANLHKTYCR
jgi:hypothetical protein